MNFEEAMDNLRIPKVGETYRLARYLYDAALEEAAKVVESSSGNNHPLISNKSLAQDIRQLKTPKE